MALGIYRDGGPSSNKLASLEEEHHRGGVFAVWVWGVVRVSGCVIYVCFGSRTARGRVENNSKKGFCGC
jgi:hypothetical protein